MYKKLRKQVRTRRIYRSSTRQHFLLLGGMEQYTHWSCHPHHRWQRTHRYLLWSRNRQFGRIEVIWEGTFALIASIIISVMGAALLRVWKLQAKWRIKLIRALEAKDNITEKVSNRFKVWCSKYATFVLPFFTILREGLQATIFFGGVIGFTSQPRSSRLYHWSCGWTLGRLHNLRGRRESTLAVLPECLHLFPVSCAYSAFSHGIWYVEYNTWNRITGGDDAVTGSGAGSYDIRRNVWHVN